MSPGQVLATPPLLVGAVLALAVGLFTSGWGMDRDRALYPSFLMVIAALYVLFAVIGDASTHVLLLETLIAAVFIAAAVIGFRVSLWIAAAALVAHGLMDLVHHRFIPNPGVPAWWPSFCMAYDVVAGAYLAWLLHRGRVRVARSPSKVPL